ncbi:MAG: phosphate/phosphite/phosphonate ABC transporter substrate-binding protein [Dehalococcoidia bacterium]|nr:phosphate/phosphite/phosphonate ABC transporter substrate-binding protein [Dehalococcoidia bacterium]MDW8119384.1 phosphate/phosphite/phosphonate ABC transporter substrate-binding protein [Chloroflexota bacterium]
MRHRWMLLLIVLALVVGAGMGGFLIGGRSRGGTSPAQETPQRVVIAIQPTMSAAEMLEKARPLEQFLEQQLGGKVDVQIYVPTSYAAVVESLRFGQAQVAFMSAWPSYLATQMAGAEVALAEVREVVIGQEKREAPFYYSYWVVRADSPYENLLSLKGKRACFPSPISTSGYVAPMGRLVELGYLTVEAGREADPKAFFGDVLFGGGYAQCWQALQQGQVDVTIIAGDVSERLYREVLANTRVLEQQGPIPSHAVVVSKDLAEPLRSQVLQAIEGLGAPEYRPLMRSFISSIFVRFQSTTAQEHLATLQRYLRLAGLKFTERLG